MSNAQKNETKASAQPPQSSAPDGKSQLPTGLPDFPVNPNDPGPSNGPVPK